MLFRELLPQLGTKRGEKIIEDPDVFEYSTYCWAYLLSETKVFTYEFGGLVNVFELCFVLHPFKISDC